MNEPLIILYLAVVVTPLALGTLYAIYIFCASTIELRNLQKKYLNQDIEFQFNKNQTLKKLNLHLSKTNLNEKDHRNIEIIKNEIERY